MNLITCEFCRERDCMPASRLAPGHRHWRWPIAVVEADADILYTFAEEFRQNLNPEIASRLGFGPAAVLGPPRLVGKQISRFLELREICGEIPIMVMDTLARLGKERFSDRRWRIEDASGTNLTVCLRINNPTPDELAFLSDPRHLSAYLYGVELVSNGRPHSVHSAA